MAAGRLYAAREPRARLLAARMVTLAAVSLLPDADVIGFALGVAYEAPFGHRGASHAIVTAIALGLLGGLVGAWQAPRPDLARRRGLKIGAFSALVAVTHGLLDALTDGGRGVALLWPFTTERFFFSWRPIPVAPIGIHFLSREGWEVFRFELLAFAPLLVFALFPRRARKGP